MVLFHVKVKRQIPCFDYNVELFIKRGQTPCFDASSCQTYILSLCSFYEARQPYPTRLNFTGVAVTFFFLSLFSFF